MHLAKEPDKKMSSTVESLTDKLFCNIIVLVPLHLCSESQSDLCKRRRIMSVALTPFRITQRCILARRCFGNTLVQELKPRPLGITSTQGKHFHLPGKKSSDGHQSEVVNEAPGVNKPRLATVIRISAPTTKRMIQGDNFP